MTTYTAATCRVIINLADQIDIINSSTTGRDTELKVAQTLTTARIEHGQDIAAGLAAMTADDTSYSASARFAALTWSALHDHQPISR